jgi:endonuclease YncB( thermonuclease family)
MRAHETSNARWAVIALTATAYFLFLIALFSKPSLADFSARVVSVLDDDTIEVLHNSKAERIRLIGIDCPEKGQAFGKPAKQAASALVFGKEVTFLTHGHDKDGRTQFSMLTRGFSDWWCRVAGGGIQTVAGTILGT